MKTSDMIWKPGSFTKEFGWRAEKTKDLSKLYESIKIGFNDRLEDVPRAEFRRRIRRQERADGIRRIDLIPINFFLFNKRIDGIDYIIADELVFHAVTSDHSSNVTEIERKQSKFIEARSRRTSQPGRRMLTTPGPSELT